MTQAVLVVRKIRLADKSTVWTFTSEGPGEHWHCCCSSEDDEGHIAQQVIK